MSNSTIDFPSVLASREEEIASASDVAAANEHVRRFPHALLNDGYYCLEIHSASIPLESPKDVDIAHRLFLASPQANQESRRRQAKQHLVNGKLAA